MANLYYDPINGGVDLQVWKDPQVVTRESLEDERDALLNIQGLSDELREIIAANGLSSIGLPSFIGVPEPLTSFDQYIEDELDRLRDVLDYFEYESGQADFSIRTGDWFLPEAVESFTDDNGSDVVTNAIDAANGGDPDPNDPENSTFWQSEISGTRQITFRLRDYSKRVEGIRLRTNNGDTRSQLQDLTVRASNALGMIDDPGNIMVSGVNVNDARGWFEINFTKHKCRYIKIEAATSNFGTPDVLRIRSMQVRVGITNHDR